MERFKNRYRHELKYLADDRDIVLLGSELGTVMKLDAHNKDGPYRIRSVYFDDSMDSAMQENLDGVSPRAKFRIRTYNDNADSIFLEKKIKDHDMTGKKSCLITRQECEALLNRKPVRVTPENSPDRELLMEFKALVNRAGFVPKIVVEYERTAYVCREGNVRITFDRNIASSRYVRQFFSRGMPKRPVMPSGKHILEVKYDEFLPSYIKKSINTGKMDRATFSKYVMCRHFTAG